MRHEFLHALAFKHEHQNLSGPCQDEFRWENDPGYVPTQDGNGVFVADAAGRRPGIYTYLAGAPNRWPRAKVDHNLRPDAHGHTVAGTFDPASVMLYRFPALFYKSNPSACAPSGDGQSLSTGDVAGLLLLYPRFGPEQDAFVTRRRELLNILEGTGGALALEATMATGPASGAAFASGAAATLRHCLKGS